jgi:hypothetical protein
MFIRTAGEWRPRRLILDYERQWTPVMLKILGDEALAITELPAAGELQHQVWSDFSGNKWDTLLLSEVPPFDFPIAAFSQLIILTPLRPMTGISTMVDWSLTLCKVTKYCASTCCTLTIHPRKWPCWSWLKLVSICVMRGRVWRVIERQVDDRVWICVARQVFDL